jgi:hypothetical protein
MPLSLACANEADGVNVVKRCALSLIVLLALLSWAGNASLVQAAAYWTCSGDKWVAVGNPQYPMPITACGSRLEIPQTQAACEQAGGRWGPAGRSWRPMCKMPTHDGGRLCGDSTECEGMCLAAPTPEQRELIALKRQKLEMLGKCTAYRPMFGCMYIVRQGLVGGRLCRD